MQQKFENILTMAKAVIAHLDDNQSVWAALPAFVTNVTNLKMKRDELAIYLNRQTQKTQGVTLDKQKLKDLAITQALIVSGNIEVFAADNEDNTLRINNHFTKSNLTQLSDSELAIKLQLIHDTANTHLAQMANYGNTVASLANFQLAITDYDNSVVKPRNVISQKKSATANITNIIKQVTKIIKLFDKLTLNFVLTNPDFVAEYQNNRQVLDMGHRKTRLEVVLSDDSHKHTVGAIVVIVFENDTFTTKTNSEGVALFADIPKGEYEVSITQDGFDDYVESGVSVKTGKTTHLKVQLSTDLAA